MLHPTIWGTFSIFAWELKNHTSIVFNDQIVIVWSLRKIRQSFFFFFEGRNDRLLFNEFSRFSYISKLYLQDDKFLTLIELSAVFLITLTINCFSYLFVCLSIYYSIIKSYSFFHHSIYIYIYIYIYDKKVEKLISQNTYNGFSSNISYNVERLKIF